MAVVDPRVGTADKEEGAWMMREIAGGKGCNGTIRGGLTGKADLRPAAKSLFPGERRVSTLFSSQIKPTLLSLLLESTRESFNDDKDLR